MKKRFLFIAIIGFAVILAMVFWYLGMPKNTADRILESMKGDYDKIESIFYTGFVDLGEDSVLVGETEYYLIEDEYETLHDLEELLGRVYTKEMAGKILSQSTEGDAPIIIEQEGRLYKQDAYDSGYPFEMPIEAAKKMNHGEISVEAASANSEDFIVCIILTKENGQWKIKGITEQERQR